MTTPRMMDAPAKRWLAKAARENFWRVDQWMDVEDLINDGALCWQIVCVKYPNVTDAKQLMVLFQRTYINHIHKLANKRSNQVPEEKVDELPITQIADDTDSQLHQLAAEAPAPLHHVLEAIIRNPALLDTPFRRKLNGQRQTTNEWLCSLVSLDPERYDVREQLEQLAGIK